MIEVSLDSYVLITPILFGAVLPLLDADGICPGLKSLRGGEFDFLFAELEKAYRGYIGYGAEAANCVDDASGR
tara:strand:+ start:612 stop:830 length:219 start_codon:yes stop_codon:yes gene_type:complete